MSVGMLIDTTYCIGCDECVVACKKENKLGEDKPRRWKRKIDALSSTRFTTVVQKEEMFVRRFCRHCLEPACVSACIVGALEKTDEGAVVYDGEKCMGCRYCMMACPFGIPRYDWEEAVPYVRKCTFCYPRIKEGKTPACAEACEEGAVTFGERDALIETAKKRIADRPNRYIDKVYGETEVGGTSVIYISDISLDFLSWKPEMGDDALPDLTHAALSKVPPIIVGMGGLMAGIAWITHRRMKLQEENQAARKSPGKTDGDEPETSSATKGEGEKR